MKTLFACLTLVFALAACATPPPDNPDNACKIFEEKRSWYKATKRAEKKWGTPKEIQLAIIYQESAFEAKAKPERRRFLFVFPGLRRKSSSYGYSQAIDGTWDWYKKETGNRGADRDNFADAADFVAWYGRQSKRIAGVALNDGYNQYLAYHEGHQNYKEKSYRKRKRRWVMEAARNVDARAARYRRQLAGCEKKFNRGIPLVPFI
ncbi:MAG: transglycosylase SLT domain-containing protein [Pseudomonadota bacterium]